MATAEITVRGAGIFGLSIAWACAQRGARVTVIDPAGHAAGASGGIVGALAPHVPENWNPKKQFQLESLLMAKPFWSEVAEIGGQDPGYARLGRIQPIADEASYVLAMQRGENAKDLWKGAAYWSLRPSATGAWSAPSPSGFEVFDDLSARVHPRKACMALVAALERKGVQVVREGKDEGVIVHATGVAGLHELNDASLRLVGTGIKGQAALLDYAAPSMPQLYVDTLHIIPHADGTTAVGSTTEREYHNGCETDALLDDVIARARAAVPALYDASVLDRWAGLRPRSRSRAPMLGAWPGRPGHFIANGGFKTGFGMAPKVAEVMADLILNGQDNIPPGFEVAASV